MPRRRGGKNKKPVSQEAPAPPAVQEQQQEEQLRPEDVTQEEWEGGGEMDLPWEMWVEVVGYLSSADMTNFSLTCSLFNSVSELGMTWRQRLPEMNSHNLPQLNTELIDGHKIGWKNACKALRRLHWACHNIEHPILYTKRAYFDVPKAFNCIAVDEDHFSEAPDMVALGFFGARASTDCVHFWRSSLPTGTTKAPTWHHWRSLRGHQGTVSCMQFIDDASRFVTGSWDKTIKVWDKVNNKEGKSPSCVATMSGHTFEIERIACHQSLLASGGQDRTVALWDLPTAKRTHTFIGHQHFVTGVAFDKANGTVVSSSRDKTICVWDPRAGCDKPVTEHVLHQPVTTFALGLDGNRVYFAPFDEYRRRQCWVDHRRPEREVLQTYGYYNYYSRLYGQVASAQYMRAQPIRLSTSDEYLFVGSVLVGVSSNDDVTKAPSVHPLHVGYPAVHFDGSKGVCWTNGQVLVAGGGTRVFMADFNQRRQLAPRADELQGKAEIRARLAAIAQRDAAVKKRADLSTVSREQAELDVARAEYQMAQMRRAKRAQRVGR